MRGLADWNPAHETPGKKLAPRWFLMRSAHAREPLSLLQPRWAMSLMLGPMTRS
jgi:hypothetical protein